MSRRKVREAVVESIFQLNFSNKKFDELKENLVEICKEKKVSLDEVLKYVDYIYKNFETIDNEIKENLKNWTFERIGNVEKSVLRMSVYEIKDRKDIPIKVIFDEAVELCKKYSEESSGKFVNGILDKIARKYERV